MDILFWFLVPVCFVFWLTSSSELNNVKRKLKRLERNKERSGEMSRFFKEMIGKKPIIVGELFGTDCWEVVDADDDWVKLSKTNKKGQTRVKLMRIDDIKSVELRES